jgi:hypothetical protein
MCIGIHYMLWLCACSKKKERQAFYPQVPVAVYLFPKFQPAHYRHVNIREYNKGFYFSSRKIAKRLLPVVEINDLIIIIQFPENFTHKLNIIPVILNYYYRSFFVHGILAQKYSTFFIFLKENDSSQKWLINWSPSNYIYLFILYVFLRIANLHKWPYPGSSRINLKLIRIIILDYGWQNGCT